MLPGILTRQSRSQDRRSRRPQQQSCNVEEQTKGLAKERGLKVYKPSLHKELHRLQMLGLLPSDLVQNAMAATREPTGLPNAGADDPNG